MRIIEKLAQKSGDIYGAKPVTIAFLGDSVTQGCFECYKTGETSLETVFDYKSAYSTRVREILNLLYPNAQVNIVNSGISGDGAANGANRFLRDIAPYSPDLVVVSYGLNDSGRGEAGLNDYGEALDRIFKETAKMGTECIFLTQNYMCLKTSPHLKDELFKNLAENFAKTQKDGTLDKYFEEAKKRCEENGVIVCDLRAAWEKWANGGVDVTELLANKLNHPVREIHYYMAIKLIETMFGL